MKFKTFYEAKGPITKDMKWCDKCQTRTMHDRIDKGKYVCRYCNQLKRATVKEDSCPLHDQYGEMPDVGGFGHSTEYEIGAQQIAEAAHCILGSIHKIKARLNNTDIKDAVRVEKGHIREELGIILRAIEEYERDLYIGRVFNAGSDYANKTIDSLQKQAPRLKVAAQSAKQRIDIPSPLKEVAEYSYDVIIDLANALEESVKGVEPGGRPVSNAFQDRKLKNSVGKLAVAVDVLYPQGEE